MVGSDHGLGCKVVRADRPASLIPVAERSVTAVSRSTLRLRPRPVPRHHRLRATPEAPITVRAGVDTLHERGRTGERKSAHPNVDAIAEERVELGTWFERDVRGEEARAVVHAHNIFHVSRMSMGTVEQRRSARS